MSGGIPMMELGPGPSSIHSSDTEESIEEVTQIAVLSSTGQRSLFHILPNEPDGNCMFRALSQAIYNHQDLHARCRQEVVKYIVHDLHWNNFLPHIRGQNEFLLMNSSGGKVMPAEHLQIPMTTGTFGDAQGTEEDKSETWKEAYQSYMLKDSVYGTLQELLAASEVFQFNLVVIRQISDYFFNVLDFQDHLCWDTTHHFLFTGTSADDGHFEYLQHSGLELNKLNRGYYKLTEVEEIPNCVVIEEYFGPLPSFDPKEEKTEDEINKNETKDFNSNLLLPDGRPETKVSYRRPASLKGASNSDTDESGSHLVPASRSGSKIKQLSQNRVHPHHRRRSRSNNQRLLRRGGSEVNLTTVPKWKTFLFSILCCGWSPEPLD